MQCYPINWWNIWALPTRQGRISRPFIKYVTSHNKRYFLSIFDIPENFAERKSEYLTRMIQIYELFCTRSQNKPGWHLVVMCHIFWVKKLHKNNMFPLPLYSCTTSLCASESSEADSERCRGGIQGGWIWMCVVKGRGWWTDEHYRSSDKQVCLRWKKRSLYLLKELDIEL